MAITKDQEAFKKYLLDNKSKLNLDKFKNLDSAAKNSMQNEWKSTWTIWNNYFLQQPTKTTVVPKKVTPSNPVTNQSWVNQNWTVWKLGWTSESNTLTQKVLDTWKAFENQQNLSAGKSETLDRARWQEEQNIITYGQQWARNRYDNQKEQLDVVQWKYEDNVWNRRADADALMKRQEWIATRQANIWAAKAWESGLQMSAWAMNDITNDIVAQYGTNIANAEQFKLQTNMSLDEWLKNTWLDIFKNKQSIDNFINNLDKDQYQPLLNAVAAATEWNKKAVSDIKDFYNWIINKKVEWETSWMLKTEYLADTEREWQNANPAKRLALLENEFKEAWISDAYIWNPDKFKNQSWADARNTLMKDQNIKTKVEAMVASATMYWTLKDNPWLKAIADEMWIDYQWAEDRTDRTFEAKTIAKWDNFNTNKLTNQTWSTIPEKNNQTLQASTIQQLTDWIKKYWIQKMKDWVLKKFRDKVYTQTQYDRIMNFLNSK